MHNFFPKKNIAVRINTRLIWFYLVKSVTFNKIHRFKLDIQKKIKARLDTTHKLLIKENDFKILCTFIFLQSKKVGILSRNY